MTILTFVIIFAVGLFALTRYLEMSGVFFPSRTIMVDHHQLGIPSEDVYITTRDGVKINAWFYKHPRHRATVIFAHGNAGNMGDRLLKVKFFYDLGLNVLIFDYRGYGRSEGKPSEAGIYKDIEAVYDYLKSRGDIAMDQIIAYGSSMGGIAAIHLASKRPVALLIADSTITSAKDVARKFYPYVPSFMLSIRFDNVRKIQDVKAPKLFMHSPQDAVVPFDMGRRLFEAAPSPKTFIQSRGGHNEIQIVSDLQTKQAFIDFLSKQGLI